MHVQRGNKNILIDIQRGMTFMQRGNKNILIDIHACSAW